MFKANTGSSTNANAKIASAEAAAKAKEGLDSLKMAYVYASCFTTLMQHTGIQDEMPEFPLSVILHLQVLLHPKDT